MIISNKRENFEHWSDWYIKVQFSTLYWIFIRSFRGRDLASKIEELKHLEKRVENSVAMEFYHLYNGDLTRVAQELWDAVEIPLYRAKLDIVYLMSIDWLRKNIKSYKNVRKELLETT